MTTYIYEYNTVQHMLMLKNISSKINACDRKILKVFHKYIVLEFIRGKISIYPTQHCQIGYFSLCSFV